MAATTYTADATKQLIQYKTDAGVAVITMDDPPANTYTYEMNRQLDEAILKARMDNDVYVIVLAGAGDKFFSAGANIRMLSSVDPTFKYYFCLHANETLLRLEHILSEEEEHASDLVDLLYIVDPATGQDRGIDPGTNALNIGRGGQGGREQQGDRERAAASGGQQPRQASGSSQQPSGGDGGRQPLAGPGAAPPAHEPGNVGRPQRQRPEQTAITDVDDQIDEGGQRGTTRAVRVTKPNRKKRVA